MIQQDKGYYTPDKEDLYLGYIYETENDDNKWVEVQAIGGEGGLDEGCVFDSTEYILREGRIRTKYLTRQCIEEYGYRYRYSETEALGLGEEYVKETKNEEGGKVYIYLKQWNESKRIYIYCKVEDRMEDENVLYNGECKSINELRKIEQWVIR